LLGVLVDRRLHHRGSRLSQPGAADVVVVEEVADLVVDDQRAVGREVLGVDGVASSQRSRFTITF
jgi:hypothetical protein